MQWTTVKSGIQRAELLPAHQECRQPPKNLVAADAQLFAHEFQRHWGPCEVVELKHLSVLGLSWVQWRWSRLVDQYKPSYGPKRRKRGRLKDLMTLLQPCLNLQDALWVHDDWSGNYFHWFTDVLPKLQAWAEAGQSCRRVLVPEDLLQRTYVRESLEKLGFEPIQMSGQRLQLKHLTVINATAPTGNFRADLLKRLRQTLCHTGDSESFDTLPCKLYISRADAAQRFVRNEADLIPTLAAHNIHLVHMEGRSLAEQITLLSNCRLLVGLHGAGLTNMLWMPLGSQIVEIRRRGDDHNNCYYALACALGHSYTYLQADDLLPDQMTHSAELFLDPTTLQHHLQSIHEDLSC